MDVNDDCNCRASPSFSPAAFMASDIPVACPQHQPARPSERHSLENVLVFPPMSSSDPSHFPARQDISFHCHTFKTLFMRSKPPSKLQSVRLATWLSPLPCLNPQDQRQIVCRIQPNKIKKSARWKALALQFSTRGQRIFAGWHQAVVTLWLTEVEVQIGWNTTKYRPLQRWPSPLLGGPNATP